jgi:hypothetical protein
MKHVRHIIVIAAGALIWLGVSFLVVDHLPARLAWFSYPFALPAYFALLFGSGGENMNVVAGNVAWVCESLLIGVLVDLGFTLLARQKAERRQ